MSAAVLMGFVRLAMMRNPAGQKERMRTLAFSTSSFANSFPTGPWITFL